MRYIKRNLESTVKKYLKIFPVVGVTGPRQSGKSTMLSKTFGDKYRYLAFDNIHNINYFQNDPVGFLDIYSEYVIFDEVQYVPELFRYIKINVDKNRSKRGNFILTGSSQFTLMSRITESLAGRIGLLSLLPFDYTEMPVSNRSKSMFLGCYPELSEIKYSNTEEWYASYINTYLERDVRTLSNIGDLRDFSQFVKLLAANSAQILNLTEISNNLGISVNTVKKWISILEASYIIFLLPPYYKNIGKRLVKRPKIYFYDTGLVTFLTGLNDRKSLMNNPFAGNIFENYIISEIRKIKLHTGQRSDMYFLRTSNGAEIDLIIIEKQDHTFIEIKYSSTFKFQFVKQIESFLPDNAKGILIYNGEDMMLNRKIKVVNYKNYLGNMSAY